MKSSPRRRLSALVASAAALAAAAATLPASSADARQADQPTVLARHLVAPLSLAVNREGTAFVSQNFGGPILRVAQGHRTRSVTSAPPQIELGGVSRRGRTTTFTVTGTATETQAASSVKRIRDGVVQRIGNLGRAETNRNPDGDVLYGFTDISDDCASQIDPETFGPASHTGLIDSHPYGTAVVGSTTYVADAAANVIWSVADHKVRVLSQLPPMPGEVTTELAHEAGLPDCTVGHTFLSEPVPTDVEVGHDGLLYVSTLAGEFPGAGGVFAIDPTDGTTTQVISGLSDTTGLAVARNGDIYVAQLFEGLILKFPGGGGEQQVFASLDQPACLEISQGDLYATVNVLAGLGFKQRQISFGSHRTPRADGPNGKLVRWAL